MKSSPAQRLFLEIFFLIFLSSLAFLLYSNTFESPFTFDDWSSIEANPSIRIENLTWDAIKKAAFDSKLERRPVPYVTLALNYYFHQYELPGYHLVNIIIHLITGILLFYLFKVTFALVRQRQPAGFSDAWLPFAATLIWLVHPLHIQSVTYVIQRMNSLAVMFYILALLLYVRARLASSGWRRIVLFFACALSAIIAFGCKEIVFTLPVFILLYEWFFLQNMNYAWLKRRMVLLVIMAAVGVFVGLYITGFEPAAFFKSSYATRDFTLIQRVLTESRVVVLYLSLLIFPHPDRLNFDHDFPLSSSFIDPGTTLLSIVFIVTLFFLALILARKERLLSFCIVWFLGNLVIESSVIGLEIIFEHRTYLPSVMVVLGAVVLADRFMTWSRVKGALLLLVVVSFSLWTYQRNEVWTDEVALLMDSVAKSPQKARVHANLAYALEKNDENEAALIHYQKALRLKPSRNDKLDIMYYNYANLLLKMEKFAEAVDYYYKSIELNPNAEANRSNLGYALGKLGRKEEAIEVMQELVGLFPENARAHNDLGLFLVQQGKIASAGYHFNEAVRLGYGEARINLQSIEKIRSRRKRSRSLFMTTPRR
jgi:tetratricopeptide (TPR) repeat protein